MKIIRFNFEYDNSNKNWKRMNVLYNNKGQLYFRVNFSDKALFITNFVKIKAFLENDPNIKLLIDVGNLSYTDSVDVYMRIVRTSIGYKKMYEQIMPCVYNDNMIEALNSFPVVWEIVDDFELHLKNYKSVIEVIEYCNTNGIHYISVDYASFNRQMADTCEDAGLKIIVNIFDENTTGLLPATDNFIIQLSGDLLSDRKQYIVAYDNNGIYKEILHEYGIGQPLLSCRYLKEGFSFLGWKAYRESDHKTCYCCNGEKKYYIEGNAPEGWNIFYYPAGYNAAKLSHVNNDRIIMKAQWKAETNDDKEPEKIEYSCESLHNAFFKRSIVLVGNPDRCALFYNRYKKVLNIRKILSKTAGVYIDEQKSINFKYEKYNKKIIQNNDYIIVCSPVKIWFDDEYEYWKRMLSKDGFTHFQDYIRSGVAKGILQNRKLWIWIGFCQLDQLRFIFGELDSVRKEYFFLGMRMGKDTVKTSYKFDDAIDLLRICDVCSYTSWIFSRNLVDFDFQSVVSPRAKKVSLPRIAFRGFYPYKDTDIDTHHKYTFDGDLHWPFSYAENVIDNLIIAGHSNEEIISDLMRDDYYDENTILRNYKIAIKSIKLSEAHADIKISDYIENNIKIKPLYKDGLHYQNNLYFELARRIAKVLEIRCEEEIDTLEDRKREQGIEYIDFTEIPVLPCVSKTLGLSFVDNDTLYRVKFTPGGKYRGTKFEIKLLNIREWISMYADYTRAQISLKKIWNHKEEIKI